MLATTVSAPFPSHLRAIGDTTRPWPPFRREPFCCAVEHYHAALAELGLTVTSVPPLLRLIRNLPDTADGHEAIWQGTIAHLRRIGIYPRADRLIDDFSRALPWFARECGNMNAPAPPRTPQTSDLIRLTLGATLAHHWSGNRFFDVRTPRTPEIPTWQVVWLDPYGVGGASNVYLVQDQLTNTPYAMKRLSTVNNEPDALTLSALNELQFSGGPDERHFVRTLYVGQQRDRNGEHAYEILEWMNGNTITHSPFHRWTLRDPWLQRRMVRQMIDLVAECHRRKIIHRDIKESNFLCHVDLDAVHTHERNPQEIVTVKLADFGIAIRTRDAYDADPTRGTHEYMAPELFMRAKDTPARDVYALGVTLTRWLTGRSPYRTPWEQRRQYLRGDTVHRPAHRVSINGWQVPHQPDLVDCSPHAVLSTRSMYRDVPPLLAPILQRAVAKDPTARYPDAITMLADFDERMERENSVVAPPNSR